MTAFLRQSTAETVVLGSFVDQTDGFTAETALTISQADIRLSKNGGAFAQTNNAAGATHMENGHYSVPLNTTDTNTLGRLRVAVNESGALPVWRDFMVMPANVWDSLYGADQLQVHVNEMTAGIITATVIADASIDAATFAAGAINAAAIAADAITDAKVAADVTIASVTGAVGSVTGNVGGNVVGSVASVTAGVTLAASAVQAIWDALTSALITVGSIGKLLVDNINATISSRATQVSVDDLPTNTELATSQAAADDATLAAIAALNNLSAAQVNTEVDTALSDVGVTTTVTGRIDAAITTRATPAQVNTEVLDVLVTDTFAEPSAVPAATSSIKDKLNWLFVLARNKLTQTATTQLVRNDADAATVGTATVSDDATTAIRGKFS